MKIKITRKYDFADGKTKSIMDVLFEDFGLTICSVREIEGKNGIFFSVPNEKYTDKEGATKYKNYVNMETDTYFSFQNSLKDAYANYDSVQLPKDEVVTSTGNYTSPSQNITYDDGLPF